MKKRIILSLAIMATVMTTAMAQEVPQVANVLNRQTTSLNGDWHYIVDVQEEGYFNYRMKPFDTGFMLNAKPQRPEDLIEYDFDATPTMHVPGDWNTQDERFTPPPISASTATTEVSPVTITAAPPAASSS